MTNVFSKLGTTFFVLGLISFTSTKMLGQVTITSTVPPNTPAVNICADTITCTVTMSTFSAVTGVSLNINLGTGVRYLAGSITKVSSTNGSYSITEFNISNLNSPIFSVTNL